MKFYSNKYGVIENNTPIEEETNANQGEKLLKQYFRNKGYTVLDVHKNEFFYDKDIDIFVSKQPDPIEEPVAIEIKWDTKIHKTGNLFIEFRHRKFDENNQLVDQNTGWFNMCQADLLFYGDSRNKRYYVFKFQELKNYIYKNKKNYYTAEVPDYGTKRYRRSENVIVEQQYIRGKSNGWLVPLEELAENISYQVLQL